MTRVLRFLGIQSGEEKLAAGLFSYSLFIGVGRVFVLTASQALFLEFFPASDLAYVYMIAAVATIATSAIYLRLGRRLSVRDLILANLVFTLVVTVILRLLLGATDAGWPAMALAAWFHVVFALSSFAFWGAATQVVDIRQGKRLFPIATTGDVVAFSLGGFFILAVVDRLGTANLLWIGAGGFALALVALLFTLAASARPLAAGDARGRREEAAPVRWNSRYLRLMMAYFVLSAAVFVFLDNAFNDVAQRRFEGAAELARFFATYSAIAAIVNFFFRSLVAGRLVRRFGLVVGLAILPAAVGLGAAAVAASGTLLAGLGLVFWLTTATRLSDKVLRGVQYSSMATLYQPLGTRAPAVQTTMDGIIDSAAIGLGGLLLLVLHGAFEIGAVELSYFLVAGCVVWVAVAFALKREFVATLGQALHRRRLDGGTIDLEDPSVRDLVRSQMGSVHAEEVVYALGLLERADDPELAQLLAPLLDHESEEVVGEALRLIADRGGATDLARIAALADDPSGAAALRGAALRTLATLSDDVPETVLTALTSDEPEVRRGAMVGLLRSGSIEGIVYAGAELLKDLRSDTPPARAAGAEALRDAALPSFRRQALPLLADSSVEVRRRAVEAAAAMDHPDLWPRVVEALRDVDLVPAASEALLAAGEPAVPFLEGALGPEEPRRARISALRILGLIGGARAARALMRCAAVSDREERAAALAALARCGSAVDDPDGVLAAQLALEVRAAADGFAALADLEGEETGAELPALRQAVGEEVRGARQRMFLLLSLLRPEADLATAWENYASGEGDRRAYALELLDSHLDPGERQRIFPVLEKQELAERVETLVRVGAVSLVGRDRRIADLAAEEGLASWTRLCARRAGAALGLDVAPPNADEGRLYERTRRLRRVELFAELPGAVVVEMVPRLESLELPPGTRVIRKGDVGDSMYVVLEGAVRVHDNGHELATFREDAVFGEFTVLQRSARTASVTTTETTRLLRFTSENLHELIREDVSVARALIRVIVGRLRATQRRAQDDPDRPAPDDSPPGA